MDCKYNYNIDIAGKKYTIVDKLICKDNKEVYIVREGNKILIIKVIYGEDNSELANSVKLGDLNKELFVKLEDIVREKNKTFLIMKNYTEGSLYEIAINTVEEKLNYIEQILNIGCYLHNKGFIHGDIKPDNFFVENNKVVLGDLESSHKLKDIYSNEIPYNLGTKGFKYHIDKYTLQDELFAFIATIYYILTKDTLITKIEFEDIHKLNEDDKIGEINSLAYEKIDKLEDENIKDFLKKYLDILEDKKIKISCCDIYKDFENLFYRRNENEDEESNKIPLKNIIIAVVVLIVIIALNIVGIYYLENKQVHNTLSPEINNTPPSKQNVYR